jgi:hypothetical protein
MPRRPRNSLDALDDLVEKAVEVAFDKGAEFFEKQREKQVAQIPAAARAQSYTCMACKRAPFTIEQMEVISAPVPGFGMCKGCFAFVWKAGEEKVKYLTKKAQEAGRRGPGVGPAPEPQARPPWLILGIDKDASIEDIKKAWRALAAKYHPDMVPPGAPDGEKEAARAKFEEVTRARDVMLKLRQPAAAAG